MYSVAFIFKIIIFHIILVQGNPVKKCELPEILTFPKDFKWVAATSAYQTEGAWDSDNKSAGIWDHGTHQVPIIIFDGSNADVAADSYHLYKEDVKALKEVGFKSYRLSIAWTRILPTGDLKSLNQKGIDYYNRLFDELLANGIEPIVTMVHWDHPQLFEEWGGFLSEKIVDYFEIYADVLFKHFGDRVKNWITINQPTTVCFMSYDFGIVPPFSRNSGTGAYDCIHNMLRSHARAYHLYQKKYKASQGGIIGTAVATRGNIAEHGTESELAAVERANQFKFGWFLHPIFSKTGGYPKLMIDIVGENSIAEGYNSSRLPVMTPEEINYIRGTADYLGINYYTTRYVDLDPNIGGGPSYNKDLGIKESVDPNWTNNSFSVSVPHGLKEIAYWLRKEYGDFNLVITENGWSNRGEMNDVDRISYVNDHLKVCYELIYCDKFNLTTYTVWSIIDNFQWNSGYRERFGLYNVDFESSTKERTPRASAKYFHDVIKFNQILNNGK